MKLPLLVLAAAGTLGLALTAPKPAEAGQVFVDVHFGLPAAVVSPVVTYEPAVIYRPRVIVPPPAVYYRTYPHYRWHDYRWHERRIAEVRTDHGRWGRY